MKKVLKLALIGCGKAARRHLALFRELPEVELLAVADLDPGRANHFAREVGAKAYTDYREMLYRHPEVEVVDIAVPSGLHAEIALSILKDFRKSLILEKPLSLLISEAREVVRTAKELGLKVITIFQNRFNRPVIKLKEALEAGRFGKLVLASVRFYWCRRQEYYDSASWRGTWALDGGVLAQQGCHHIDMLRWLLGPVREVYALARTRLMKMEAEDVLVGTFAFENGALGTVEATTCARPRDLYAELVVLGEKGSVVLGGFALNELRYWAFEEETPEDEIIRKDFASNPSDPLGYAHRACFQAVFKYLAGGTKDPRLVEGEEAIFSLELIQALYESAFSGRPVSFPLEIQYSPLGKRGSYENTFARS